MADLNLNTIVETIGILKDIPTSFAELKTQILEKVGNKAKNFTNDQRTKLVNILPIEDSTKELLRNEITTNAKQKLATTTAEVEEQQLKSDVEGTSHLDYFGYVKGTKLDETVTALGESTEKICKGMESTAIQFLEYQFTDLQPPYTSEEVQQMSIGLNLGAIDRFGRSNSDGVLGQTMKTFGDMMSNNKLTDLVNKGGKTLDISQVQGMTKDVLSNFTSLTHLLPLIKQTSQIVSFLKVAKPQLTEPITDPKVIIEMMRSDDFQDFDPASSDIAGLVTKFHLSTPINAATTNALAQSIANQHTVTGTMVEALKTVIAKTPSTIKSRESNSKVFEPMMNTALDYVEDIGSTFGVDLTSLVTPGSATEKFLDVLCMVLFGKVGGWKEIATSRELKKMSLSADQQKVIKEVRTAYEEATKGTTPKPDTFFDTLSPSSEQYKLYKEFDNTALQSSLISGDIINFVDIGILKELCQISNISPDEIIQKDSDNKETIKTGSIGSYKEKLLGAYIHTPKYRNQVASQSAIAGADGFVKTTTDLAYVMSVQLVKGAVGLDGITKKYIGNEWREKKSDGSGEAVSSPEVGSDDTQIALYTAILGQESGGDHTIINTDSGTIGLGQVKPANVGPRTKEATGIEYTIQQFTNDRALQIKVIKFKLQQYYDKCEKSCGGDQDLRIRMVASYRYHGSPDKYDSSTPQSGYPSIKKYTESVLEKFHTAQTLLTQNTKSNTPATPDKQKVVEKA